jgi:hypothetical protein
MLLARRLTEAGVPVVQAYCAAGDLNGGAGDMWDTHSDNFNRLKNRLLPVFDRGASALLADLANRGSLDQTLVVFLTDFGRTPRINGAAGRDHYPSVYSVALAGGGIRGGQVYGSSDSNGAFPRTQPCGPADVHATIYRSLGISPRAEIRDMLPTVSLTDPIAMSLDGENGTPRNTSLSSSRDTKPNAIWQMELETSKCHSRVGPKRF